MKASAVRSLLLLAAMLPAACATPSAPDIRGRWQPVNRYGQAPEAIPLQQAYSYYVSPLDGTLKGLLTRWARDSGLTLSYLHPSDFTLHAPVSGIRVPDLAQAAGQVNSAYAAQRVAITLEDGKIVVRAADAQASGGASGGAPGSH